VHAGGGVDAIAAPDAVGAGPAGLELASDIEHPASSTTAAIRAARIVAERE
jgi:hypothetical protein